MCINLEHLQFSMLLELIFVVDLITLSISVGNLSNFKNVGMSEQIANNFTLKDLKNKISCFTQITKISDILWEFSKFFEQNFVTMFRKFSDYQ